jgi:hypothetical protein
MLHIPWKTTRESVCSLLYQTSNGQTIPFLILALICQFVLYSDRFHFNANVTDQDFAETYFVAFEACVKQARARSIMCSYNAGNNLLHVVRKIFSEFL